MDICPNCGSSNIVKLGFDKKDRQKYRCKDCRAYPTEGIEYKRKSKRKLDELKPIFLDKKVSKDTEWRKWFKNFEDHKELHKRTETSQDEATVRIFPDDRGRAGVCFSADWHLGSLFTDYKVLQKNLDLILNTNNIYQITIGDLANNFRKFRSLLPVLTSIASPADQRQILSSILKEMKDKGKWIAATWGNHDVTMDEQLYGESIIADLLGKEFVYFNGKGRLNLLLGEQKYIIEMSHFYPGHSILNPNHTQGRQLRHYSPDADVIAEGHRHFPSAQWYYYFNHRVNLIQVGGFNPDDNYFKRFWEASRFGVPVVIFESKEHDCIVYHSLERYLEK